MNRTDSSRLSVKTEDLENRRDTCVRRDGGGHHYYLIEWRPLYQETIYSSEKMQAG